MLINLPSVPPTHDGMIRFLYDVANMITKSNAKCPGYSVVADPEGRQAITATCTAIDGQKYSISIDVRPVAG